MSELRAAFSRALFGSCTLSSDSSNKSRLLIYEAKYDSPSLDSLRPNTTKVVLGVWVLDVH